MGYLEDKYEVDKIDAILASFFHKIKKSNLCPKYLRRKSRKKYGDKDSLFRYYIEKYHNVSIGKYSYGYEGVSLNFIIKSIGAFSSIAAGTICIAGNHEMNYVTTSPILDVPSFGFMNDVKFAKEDVEKTITIGNDVWIGAGCLLFPNIHIGDGAVIGAGSIIRKDVPPYAVVVGLDRIVKYRFKQDTIDKLMTIQWWNWSDEKIKNNISFLYNPELFVQKFYEGR